MDINEIGTTQSVILYTLTHPKSTKIYFGEKELWNFLLTPLCSNFSLKLMKNWGSAVKQLSWLIERYLNSHETLQKYCTIYILITRIWKIFLKIADVRIFYTKFLICGKIPHLTQMRSKMWTYKHWQYLDDKENDVAGIATQFTLIYLKSTKIYLWKKRLHETVVETSLKNLRNRKKDCCKKILTYWKITQSLWTFAKT